MMNSKLIDGKIRKIESQSDSKIFFDFEFWGESDTDTYGLLCLVQRSHPKNMFITNMNPDELSMSNDVEALEIVKDRISKETGINDLVFPNVIRFDDKRSDSKEDFQAFLKKYKPSTPIYESIFDKNKEAIQVEKISIDSFKSLGGNIRLLGDIAI